MISATFDDRRGGANDPAFSVDLTSCMAVFRSPEILLIFRGNCYTSQVDADSSSPSGSSADIVTSNDLRAIADVVAPNADVSISSADVSASSTDIVASNDDCFTMF